MKRVLLATWAAAGTALACGEIVLETTSSSNASPIPTATAGAAPTLTATPISSIQDPPLPCPPRRPDENSPCDFNNQTCEYGGHPSARCNTRFVCVSGGWTSSRGAPCDLRACPGADASTASVEDSGCKIPSVDGGAPLASDELVCPMADGVCACTTGPGGESVHENKWVCVRPLPPCPASRPMAGQSCTGDLACDYGACGWKEGSRMDCLDRVWITGGSLPCD